MEGTWPREAIPPSDLGPEIARDTLVDQFRVMRLLGRGAMGTVYLARDTLLGRKVALKLVRLPTESTSRRAFTAQFFVEARAAASLSHPHVVTVFSVGQWRDVPYIAFEYVEGESLRERLARERLGLREALRIGLDLAGALAAAHAREIGHHDLKPENVLLGRDGRPRIVDFGLASSPVSRAVLGGGTPAYMAPEQWRGRSETGSDLWALGLVVFEMVAGDLPHARSSAPEIERAVCSAELPGIDRLASLPAEVQALVRALLAGDVGLRPSAREAESRLAALVAGTDPAVESGSPFRGLAAFAEEHAGIFFGREREIARFCERLRELPVAPVVGPSGAGKTSFVQAGIVPRLREQAAWTVLSMRPGARPFRTLAALVAPPGEEDAVAESLQATPRELGLCLQRAARRSRSRVLLFVDQLEEIWNADEQVRTSFLGALCAAADDRADPVRVVLAVRDDFLGRIARAPEVRDVFSNLTLLRTPDDAELRQVLEKPLARAGYAFDDPSLPDEVARAVEGQPGALPLIEFVASLLWDKRDVGARVVRREVYEAEGGVAGALARHADRVVDELGSHDASVARQLFLRLVTVDGTRIALARATIERDLGPRAPAVIERLLAARLLSARRSSTPEESGEVEDFAHESLVRTWGQLEAWLDEGREERTWLAEILPIAEAWNKRGRRVDEAWQGASLAGAERIAARATWALPEVVHAFVAAGEVRARQTRRTRKVRLGVLVGTALVITAGSLAATVVVRGQKERAERERQEALLAAARGSLDADDLPEAAARVRSALEAGDSPEARVLWRRIRGRPFAWRKDLGVSTFGVAFSPDASTLALGTSDGLIRLVDAQTLEGISLRGDGTSVQDVLFSGDGKRLVSRTTGGREVRVWDVASRTSFALDGAPGYSDNEGGLALSPDGARVAVTGGDAVVVWDVATRRMTSLPQAATPRGVALAADAMAVGGVDGHVRLLDRDGRLRLDFAAHAAPVDSLAFSPDGAWLVSGSSDRSVHVWSAIDGTERLRLQTEPGNTAVAFGPQGTLVASCDPDTTCRVWETATGALRAKLDLAGSTRWQIAFRPDGRQLVAALTGSVRGYWLDGPAPAPSSNGHALGSVGLAFSPDDRQLVSTSVDGALLEWDASTGRSRTIARRDVLWTVAYSPDGEQLAYTARDGVTFLLDRRSGGRSTELPGAGGGYADVAFSRDGAQVAATGRDGTLRVWDVRTGAVHAVLAAHGGPVKSVDFSKDGTRVGTVGTDGLLKLWNLPDLSLVRSYPVASGATLRFAPDGRAIALGSLDGLLLLDVASGATQTLAKGRMGWPDFGPDGRHVGMPEGNGVARILELESGRTLSLRGHQAGQEVNFIRFSHDGRQVATTSDDTTVRLFDAATGLPIWRAPAMLGDPPMLFSQRGWEPMREGAALDLARAPRETVERARRVAESAEMVCALSEDGKVAAFRRGADEPLFTHAEPGAVDVVASSDACLVLAGGHARSHRVSGVVDELEGATAIGVAGSDRLFAGGGAVYVEHEGRRSRFDAEEGVSALALVEGRVVAGHADGRVELIATDGSAAHVWFAPESTRSTPVARVAEGPLHTLFVGYESGVVSLVVPSTGWRMQSFRLHGRVAHLRTSDHVLYAASDLGDATTVDLSSWTRPYCDELREVWRDVAVVLEAGRLVARPRPASHACAPAPLE